MNRLYQSAIPLACVAILSLPSLAVASEETHAEKVCTDKITQISGVSNFRHIWAERLGHHKFRVHGKARDAGHKWIFDCKVKRGHIKSYNYSGPLRRKKDDDNNHLGTALAIGAGLAIVAALAASADDDGKPSSTQPKKTFLEDDCMEQLQYRVRDEHHHAARIHLTNADVKGHNLVGEARVRYDHQGHKATYTCHFDRNWRLKDSSYYLY